MTNDDPETFMFMPMAISLAFGVLFATAITLFLVPSLYLMLEDFLSLWGRRSEELGRGTNQIESGQEAIINGQNI